jgi:hypothetical protein
MGGFMYKKSVGTQQKIIEGCLQNLRKLDCCEVEFTSQENNKKLYDGLLRLFRNEEQFEYLIDIKRRPTMSKAAMFLHKLRDRRSITYPFMIFSDYIHEQLGEHLRENNIEFVDLAGNIFINRPSLYIYVLGRKVELMPEKTTRAFQATGLKIIFLFLKKPESIKWNYRQIEQATGTSLGGIAWVIRDLRETGFVRLKKSGIRQSQRELIKRRELLDRWDLGYAEKLRPDLFYKKCHIAGDRSLDDLLKDIQDSNERDHILISGELGAAFLINDLRPETATLHFLANPLKLMTLLKLIPDPDGNIDILDSFGTLNHFEKKWINGLTLADPLLIRAELLLRGSERLRAIADNIYSNFIRDRLSLYD